MCDVCVWAKEIYTCFQMPVYSVSDLDPFVGFLIPIVNVLPNTDTFSENGFGFLKITLISIKKNLQKTFVNWKTNFIFYF